MTTEELAGTCLRLASLKTRGELGHAIAEIVLSPAMSLADL
jgi:hypothetical protein